MNQPQIDIAGLTSEEKLDLIERLWESLASGHEEVRLTEAQRAELDRRLDEMERGEVGGIPWEEVVLKADSQPLKAGSPPTPSSARQ